MPRVVKQYHIDNNIHFRKKLFLWCSRFSPSIFLDSHVELYPVRSYSKYDCLAGAGSISFLSPDKADSLTSLKEFHTKTKDWLFGFFSYDLKNELENLTSDNFDLLYFPVLHFFQPEYLFLLYGNTLKILYNEEFSGKDQSEKLFQEIHEMNVPENQPEYTIKISPRMLKNEYLKAVENLRMHIKRGDIYEANLCQEFFAESVHIYPYEAFLKLQEISPAPFSCWYHTGDKYLMSSSPERFLKKDGMKIISQPIKGTFPRGRTPEEDVELRQQLENDSKERSENIMIVDLVRNDLSRTAKIGSVKVQELCGIYSFPQVHQMISTVISEFNPEFHWTDLIRTTFPMGSMTGAPKIRAMELIEKQEKTKRGLYSGSVGYVTPNGDFDFNVVIRSILYNKANHYLSYQAGGAITWASDPEKEYEECLLKARGILRVLNPSITDFH